VIAGNLLGVAGGIVDDQGTDAAPSRLLTVQKLSSGQFAHQIRDDVVDELALAVGAERVVGGLCQFLLSCACDDAVHPRHHQSDPAVWAFRTNAE